MIVLKSKNKENRKKYCLFLIIALTINSLINFLIVAFATFFLVKGINKLRKKEEEAAIQDVAPTTKICRFCKSEIHIEAAKCPHCTSELL